MLKKNEEANKKKFAQLKFLVDQYREQMHEYQRITQTNQEMMGKLAGVTSKKGATQTYNTIDIQES